MKRGFSIRLFLADGTAEGLRIAEKSNWVGRGIICSRTRYAEVSDRQEFHKTGVYLLVGLSEALQLPRIYIGEGDPAGLRLDDHCHKKPFWTYLVLFVSKDDNLNKAHVQYLESKLIALAKKASRCELENVRNEALPSLSESDAADVDGFLEEMLLILPVLGISAFELPQVTPNRVVQLRLKAKGLSATGYQSTQGFVVLKDSESPLQEVDSISEGITAHRKALQANGIFERRADRFVLTQNHEFTSPSLAAGVMLARTANGRTEWKTDDGRTLREIQEQTTLSQSE